MTTLLERRGPDSEGVHTMGAATLGHRRLAIFDLSAAGHQPMRSADEQLGVVFNGAIYNWRDLRRELEQGGVRFRSETDTEVLLHGYRAWGIDGLVERLRGMYAFALWDEPARRLLLVRDRLGVKPLCYAVHDGAIAFASTPRALHAAGMGDAIDPAAVADFLEFGYVTEARSIYGGVQKLPPATIGEWRDGALTQRCYWRPPAVSRERLTYEDALARTEELLLQAVRRRLDADVPVGALLSAGIDSGLVCWAMRQLDADVTAYTVSSPGHVDDEAAGAVATARELGLRHEVLEMAGDDEGELDRLVAAYAEPFACESALGMLGVSETIAQAGIKVLLTGDGGDDVFLGYPRHRQLLLVERMARRTPRLVAGAWNRWRPSDPRRSRFQRALHLADYTAGGLAAYLDAHEGLPEYRHRGLLGPRLRDADVDERGRARVAGSGRRVLHDYLAHDIGGQFVSEYLTKVDGATMYYALEARSPFLDQELWEFASSLPFEQRMQGGTPKAILRDLARRRIGERIATLPKRGFGVPVRGWLAGPWRARAESSLRDGILARDGWLHTAPLLDELAALRPGQLASLQLLYAVVLEAWLRREAEVAARGAGAVGDAPPERLTGAAAAR